MTDLGVAVSCGYDTQFVVRLVMDYTISYFTWSILGYSEIDHTYLRIEAQCVSHHYPRWTATRAYHSKFCYDRVGHPKSIGPISF